MGQLLRYLEEKLKNPEQNISEEFIMLGGQVKQVLCGLMDKGQWEEAYGIIGQLLSLLPNDFEVIRMKQKILRKGVCPEGTGQVMPSDRMDDSR